MSHEQSETVQDPRSGKWVNVYGRKTKRAGERIPGTGEYDTVKEAEDEAKKRSKNYPATRQLINGDMPKGGATRILTKPPAPGGVRG